MCNCGGGKGWVRMNRMTGEMVTPAILMLAGLLCCCAATSEHPISNPLDMWILIHRGLGHVSIKLTEREYAFTHLSWPQSSVEVKHNVSISGEHSSPSLFSLGLLSKGVVALPGSNLKLQNIVFHVDTSTVQHYSMLPFFEIKPNAQITMTHCTILIEKCMSSYSDYYERMFDFWSLDKEPRIQRKAIGFVIDSAVVGNAVDAEGVWVMEDVSFSCAEDFDFQLLKPVAQNDIVVRPVSVSELIVGLLDKSTKRFEIDRSMGLGNSGWPYTGLLFERDISIRGPDGTFGWERPALFIGDIVPFWEVKDCVLELENLIFEFQSPYPQSARHNKNLVDSWATFGLPNSTVDFRGYITPVAFVSNFGSKYVLSNVRFRYLECPRGTLTTALREFNTFGAGDVAELDSYDTQILMVQNARLEKQSKRNSTRTFSETILTSMEFECVKEIEVEVESEEEVLDFSLQNITRGKKSSGKCQVWSMFVKLMCFLLCILLQSNLV